MNQLSCGTGLYQVPRLLGREVTLTLGGTIGFTTYRPNSPGTFSLCLGRRLGSQESRLFVRGPAGAESPLFPSPSVFSRNTSHNFLTARGIRYV